MKNATVAIEDKRFYQHGAIDPVGLARAAAVDLLTGRTQGGSTITQQFVKNVYTKGQRTLQRKLVEAVLADAGRARVDEGSHPHRVPEHRLFRQSRLRRRGGGPDLLRGAREDPQAVPGGAPRRDRALADRLRPVRHPVAATKRRNLVLAAMLQQKMISPVAYATAVNTALIPYGHKVALPAASRGVAAYFTQYVERQLVARFGVARTSAAGSRSTRRST